VKCTDSYKPPAILAGQGRRAPMPRSVGNNLKEFSIFGSWRE